jgi:2-polyprenyl-3-methyl-5-hydroxy-6-metoxy-1,4-benzoquinol methylase
MTVVEQDTQQTEALVGRLFNAGLEALDLLTVYIGDTLGLYKALVSGGPATPDELAARAGIGARYAREWLEQQAVTGILEVDDVAAAEDERRYTLPDANAAALTDPSSPFSIAPLARALVAVARTVPDIVDAFRTGGGVQWDAFPEGVEMQGDFNRPWLVHEFGNSILPSVPDVHEKLTAGACVADVACGVGWSSVAIAKAYPNVTVDGFDLDEKSVALARRNADEAGVADRVRFEVRDCAEPPGDDGRYDLAIVIEAIHDMSRPVEVLSTIRGLLAPGGTLLVADERVADTFTAPGPEIERLMYGFSVLCCLPVGMAEQPSAGTGTVMRAGTLRRYASDAGFASVEILEQIEHPMLRFYRLVP